MQINTKLNIIRYSHKHTKEKTELKNIGYSQKHIFFSKKKSYASNQVKNPEVIIGKAVCIEKAHTARKQGIGRKTVFLVP